MAQKRRQLGDILKRWNLVDDQQLSEAVKISDGSSKRIGEALVNLGYANENDVAKALAAQFEMKFIDLDQPNVIDKQHLSLVPQDIIKRYLVLPLGQEDNKLKLLVHDPMDLALIDDLRFRLGSELELALGARGKIKEYIDNAFSETQASIDQLTQDLSVDYSVDRGASLDIQFGGEGSEEEDAEEADAQQSAIIRLVNQIIQEAVLTRASDIHIEPFDDRVRLRYRIDGVCHERDRIPKRTQASVIARLKILAGMKVEEKRVPQDGRIKLKVSGDIIDFRVSSCPAYHGESMVLRILRPDAARIGLENLGMRADTLETFNNIIKRPNGIFLVTGPTGSGKTTTLYSALGELNRPDRKIITAEDPIEYNFKGINQCQVNDQIGLSFAKILRAMLRQAPNVILVGEIRDREVGEVAIQAALTGHLVFSTLHTNDAPSAMTRLVDMGLKPFLVASSIQAVLAQRLVRVLCDHCKEPDTEPNRRMMQLCGFKPEDIADHTIYKAVGCKRCSNTGYRGRRGIYELMVMNNELRELAFNRAPLTKIRQAAEAAGMRNLLGDGRLKILDGKTTLEEISRITQIEGLVEGETDEDLAA
ncbi:MAG: ATPase, T2SS/T4P/T4SS family [Phycisphaeraceae bacterium]